MSEDFMAADLADAVKHLDQCSYAGYEGDDEPCARAVQVVREFARTFGARLTDLRKPRIKRLGPDNVQGLTRDELWMLGKQWSAEANRCINLSGDYKQLALYLGDRGIAKVDDLNRATIERVLRGDLP